MSRPIRYYQRRGLLAEPVKPYGGIRRYGRAALDRVRFIKTAQRLGFSLAEVGRLLRLDDGALCGEARAHAEHALAGVRARPDDLSRMERALSELVTRCRTAGGDVQCPLIDALRHGQLEIDREP
jgi:MerR family mercuric resistance operon transcriptional regulator